MCDLLQRLGTGTVACWWDFRGAPLQVEIRTRTSQRRAGRHEMLCVTNIWTREGLKTASRNHVCRPFSRSLAVQFYQLGLGYPFSDVAQGQHRKHATLTKVEGWPAHLVLRSRYGWLEAATMYVVLRSDWIACHVWCSAWVAWVLS